VSISLAGVPSLLAWPAYCEHQRRLIGRFDLGSPLAAFLMADPARAVAALPLAFLRPRTEQAVLGAGLFYAGKALTVCGKLPHPPGRRVRILH